jgi:hypothetical protein
LASNSEIAVIAFQLSQQIKLRDGKQEKQKYGFSNPLHGY